jgi:predicted transposase/invertase (TIGR01784 family)
VSELLNIRLESIKDLKVTNPEMTPDVIGEKFCRLDINMIVDEQLVNLEIQVADEGDYPERTLYYWSRDYSSALKEGDNYYELPRTVHISIVDFPMFDCDEYHSEFRPLEVSRHTQLTDRMSLHYFELPKVPKGTDTEDELRLWLTLFDAETEEELSKLEHMEVSVMSEVIEAYRQVTATDEFKEMERLRSRARHNEASALHHARKEGIKEGIIVTARKLKAMGLSVTQISEGTGLSNEIILSL